MIPTKDQLKEFKRIVEGAPNGATHVAISEFEVNFYRFNLHEFYCDSWEDGKWFDISYEPLCYSYTYNLKLIDDIRTIIAQADEIERLKSDFREVVDITLNPTAVDFVRCGIGANYSGNYYCKMVDKIHSPIVNLMMKHPSTNSNGGDM